MPMKNWVACLAAASKRASRAGSRGGKATCNYSSRGVAVPRRSGEPPPRALLLEDAAELGDVGSGEVGPEPLEERSVVHGRALRALMEHQHVGLVEGGAAFWKKHPGARGPLVAW